MVDLDNYVPGLQGGFSAAGGAPRANRCYQHTIERGTFHLFRQQARKVPHRQPPRFELLLLGEDILALDRLYLEREFLAIALDDRSNLLADG